MSEERGEGFVRRSLLGSEKRERMPDENKKCASKKPVGRAPKSRGPKEKIEAQNSAKIARGFHKNSLWGKRKT